MSSDTIRAASKASSLQTSVEAAALPTRLFGVIRIALLGLILVSLTVKFALIFFMNIHWDEFLFLSKVHLFHAGALTNAVQSFHVHLFSWLTLLPGSEVNQMLAARAIMFFLYLGSCGLTYLIARRFLARSGALFSLFCYLMMYELIEHGTSFRVDPICSFLFLLALECGFRKTASIANMVFLGLLMGISMVLSIKAVLHLGVLVCVVSTLHYSFIGSSVRSSFGINKGIRNILTLVLSAGLSGGALFLLHRLSLSAEVVDSSKWIGKMVSLFVLNQQPSPYFFVSLKQNSAHWIFLAIGIAGVSWEVVRGQERSRSEGLLLLIFLLPLGALLFYRNALPYFYVFIISPAIVLTGVFIDRIERNAAKVSVLFPLSLIVLGIVGMLVVAQKHYQRRAIDGIASQRQLIELVHELFPEPVPYIDRCSMISSFPKVGFFMSEMNMMRYQSAGKPIFARILQEKAPNFLLANTHYLSVFNTPLPQENVSEKALFGEDRRVLKENFIHHWGILYVPGRELAFSPESSTRAFELLIPGTYTLESAHAVYLDLALIAPFETIELSKGGHTLTLTQPEDMVRLRWGDNLRRPQKEPIPVPIFHGY